MLMKLFAQKEDEVKIKKIIDLFSCKLLTVLDNQYIIEVSGSSKKLDNFLNEISFAKILDVSRTGISAILDI